MPSLDQKVIRTPGKPRKIDTTLTFFLGMNKTYKMPT